MTPDPTNSETADSKAQLSESGALKKRAEIADAAKTERAEEKIKTDHTQERAEFASEFEEFENAKKFIREKKAQIQGVWDEKMTNIDTQMARHHSFWILRTLEIPLETLYEDWEKNIKNASSNSDQILQYRADYHDKAEDIAKTAESYLNRMTLDTSYITPEVLYRISNDANLKAKQFADILASSPELIEAYQWALTPSNIEQGKAKAMKTLTATLVNQDSQTTPIVASIIGFMTRPNRIELMQRVINEQKAQDQNFDSMAFLRDVNGRGVLGPDEIKTIEEKAYGALSEEQRQQLYFNFNLHNDFSEKAKKEFQDSYGVSNATAKMLSPGSLLIFAAKAAAWTTIAANTGVNLWRGGALRNPIILLQNKPMQAAALVLGGINVATSDDTLGQVMEPKESREIHDEHQATTRLANEIGSNPAWPKLDSFFNSGNFYGGKVFRDYLVEVKGNDESAPLPVESITIAGFKAYLAKQAALQKEGAEIPRLNGDNFKYSDMQRDFEDIKGYKDENLLEIARLFDHYKFFDLNSSTFAEKTSLAKQTR